MHLPHDPAIALLAVKIYDHKNLYTNVHWSLIYNSQKLEINQGSFNKWRAEQTVVHPQHVKLLSNKKKKINY